MNFVFYFSSFFFCSFVEFKVEQYLMLSEFENNINADYSSTLNKEESLVVQDGGAIAASQH